MDGLEQDAPATRRKRLLPQSAIHDLQSYMIRDHSRFEHFLEESAPRGRAALPERTFAEKGPCL